MMKNNDNEFVQVRFSDLSKIMYKMGIMESKLDMISESVHEIKTKDESTFINLAEASKRIGVAFNTAKKLILTGKIAGRQRETGVWEVSVKSLNEYLHYGR